MSSMAQGAGGKQRFRVRWTRLGMYLLLLLVAVWTLAPLYFLIITSLKQYVGTITFPLPWLPHPFTWKNYGMMFSGYQSGSTSYRFLHALRNSLITSTATTVLNLIFGSAAAYVLARSRIRGKNAISMAFLASNLLPTVALVVPFYVFTVTYFSSLGLYDTDTLLVILYTSFSLGLVIWIMRDYFNTIPIDLEEAARVDGASRLVSLVRILLPLTTPGLMATGLLTFLLSWDNFILPLILAPNASAYNLPFFIYSLSGQYLHMNNEIAAGGILAAIPPVLIIVFFGKYIISGLTAGSVKG
ncbi:carbohydrate ABC transporter permease [Alicyclobacillaceae bacterium I2511]|nr:carbohydrate ABC transporter permease [Alicyclobacillaceae bacterium I2511]